jgi:MFS family permease
LSRLAPYLTLLRENHQFRRVWLSQVISNFGDWFGVIAVFTIILNFSDSEFLLGLVIVIKFVAFAAVSPFAGYVADRFDRRVLMLLCDFGRGAVVLSFLFVRDPSLLWLVYLLTAMQMGFAAVFEPAKQASIPNITTGDDLVKANIISNLSWSVIFTTGMGIGGLATAWMGTDAVFVINGTGYILSTWFIFRATIPHARDEETMQSLRNPVRGIIDGYRYLFSNTHILRPALAKGTITFFLGGLVYMLILVSEEILMLGSIGLGTALLRTRVRNGRGACPYPAIFQRRAPLGHDDGPGHDNGRIAVSDHRSAGGDLADADPGFRCPHGHRRQLGDEHRPASETFAGCLSRAYLQLGVASFYHVARHSVTIASLLMEYDLLTLRQAIWIFSAGLVAAGSAWLFVIGRREARWNRMREMQTFGVSWEGNMPWSPDESCYPCGGKLSCGFVPTPEGQKKTATRKGDRPNLVAGVHEQ